MNKKIANYLFLSIALFMCADIHAQVITPPPNHGKTSSDIQAIAEKIIPSLYSGNVALRWIGIPFRPSQVGVKDGELGFAMQDTQSFVDGEGVFWFVSDRRKNLDGKWSAIYFTSEDFFSRSKTSGHKFEGDQDLFLPGEGAFNALVKNLPGYQLVPLEPLRSRLNEALAVPLHVEHEEGVVGNLQGRNVYLRVPIRSAFLLDAKNQYVLIVGFSIKGKAQHLVYFPDPQQRPLFDDKSTRPGFMDGTKIVSEPVRKVIENAIQAAKAPTKLK